MAFKKVCIFYKYLLFSYQKSILQPHSYTETNSSLSIRK